VYRIKTYRGFPPLCLAWLPENRLVTLENHFPAHQLPHPILLQLHAAIAQILHATGMCEYLERIFRGQEELWCLASDGTTDVASRLIGF